MGGGEARISEEGHDGGGEGGLGEVGARRFGKLGTGLGAGSRLVGLADTEGGSKGEGKGGGVDVAVGPEFDEGDAEAPEPLTELAARHVEGGKVTKEDVFVVQGEVAGKC